MPTVKQVSPPWSQDQIDSLNAFQLADFVHPFTGTRKPNGDETVLIATTEGWVEEPGGPVVQTWAHAFMADWSWKELAVTLMPTPPDQFTK